MTFGGALWIANSAIPTVPADVASAVVTLLIRSAESTVITITSRAPRLIRLRSHRLGRTP